MAPYEFCECLKALCVDKLVSCVKFEKQGMLEFIMILFYVVIHTYGLNLQGRAG